MLNNKEFAQACFDAHDSNSLVLGGRCPVNCVFCFCKGDAKGIDSYIPFIEMEELKQTIRFINWDNKQVFLGDGISKISCEAFAHPHIYDILDFVCHSLPDHHITIMTTSTLIREDKIDFLNSLKNLTISISVNTLVESERKKIMPHPETDKVKMLIKRLDRVGTQWLDMGDTGILKADLDELNSIKKMDRFQLRRIESSRFSPEDAIALSQKSVANYENSLAYIQTNYQEATYWSPYLRYDLRRPEKMKSAYGYLSNICDFISKHKDKKYLFPAAESSYDLWNIWLRGFPNVKVCLVKNETYGGSVTVAGLMTFDDIAGAIKQIDTVGFNGLLVPKIMLNRACSDLNGESVVAFHSRISIYPIII